MADQDVDLLSKIITGDETWWFLNKIQPKCQSCEWKSN
jgi:hypothetical protein